MGIVKGNFQKNRRAEGTGEPIAIPKKPTGESSYAHRPNILLTLQRSSALNNFLLLSAVSIKYERL